VGRLKVFGVCAPFLLTTSVRGVATDHAPDLHSQTLSSGGTDLVRSSWCEAMRSLNGQLALLGGASHLRFGAMSRKQEVK
jgi:hypothetical protein